MTREEEMYVKAKILMIHCLPPEEFERFAALEQEILDSKAEMQAMLQTARDRSDWQEPTDPKELIILSIFRGTLSAGLGKFDAFRMNEPEGITRMDLGELERFTELGARLGRAWIERHEIIKATVARILP